MSTSIGTARIDIELSTADFELAVKRAKNAAAGFGEEAERAFGDQTGAAKRAATALLDYVSRLGKTREELRLLKAAGAGVDPTIISVATKAMNEYSESVHRAAQESEMMKAAMAQDANINSYLANLERQIALFGMSTQELRHFEAATSDVSQKALGLVSVLERLEAAQAHDNAVERMTNSLREQINTLGMSQQAMRRYEAQLAGVGTEVAPLLSQLDALENKLALQGKIDAATSSLERQIATFGMSPAQIRRYEMALDGVEAQVSPLIAKLEQLEAAKRQSDIAWGNTTRINTFLDGLRSQADAIGKTNSELLAMKAAQLGVSQQAAPFIAQLKAQEDALIKSTRGFRDGVNQVNKYGLSQKQLEFAMRGVPAQMTDIFVSLQGGQAPLTVLLQQGGQLKDMFGGIKPAAAALGGELLKLINVYTLTAAAIGATVIAYAKAASEIDDYNEALIRSGYHSAKNLAQMQAMAAELDKAYGITSTAAGNALQSIAAMGTFSSEQMQIAAEASLNWSRVTSDTVDDVVKKFNDIRRDPVQALKDLNAAEHFLTDAQHDRVKALIEEGKHQEAVTEAMRIYANVVNDRSKQIEENLGGIRTAWKAVKDTAGEAVDALVDAAGKADRAFKQYADGVAQMDGRSQTRRLGYLALINPAQAALTYFAGNRGGEQGAAPAASTPVRDEAAIKAEEEANKKWLAVEDRYLSDLRRMQKEEEEIRAAGRAAKKTDLEIDQQIEAMRERYRKRERGNSGRREENDTARAALQAFKDQAEIAMATVEANTRTTQAAYQAQQISAADYYNAMRGYAEEELRITERSIQGQIDYLRASKDTINNRRQIGQLEADLAKLRAKSAADLQVLNTQEADGIRKRAMEMLKFTEALERSNAAYARGLDAQVAAVGMGSKEAQQTAALTALYVEQADKLYQLELLKRENPGLVDKYDEEARLLRASYDERVRIQQESFAKMAAAEADWTNGYRRAFADLIDANRNVAENTYTFVQGVNGEMVNVFQELVATGKASTDNLVSYMLKQLAQLGTNKVMGYLMSMWSPGGNNPYGVQRESIPLPFAKGAAISSPDLSRYSNQVHDKPQFFAFAKGGGVFGEAGPEAIMPLRRNSSGRLGVEVNGGGMGAPVINVNLIGAPEGTSVGQARQEQDGSFTLDVLFGQVESYLASQVSNGAGSLNAANKARYGLKETV